MKPRIVVMGYDRLSKEINFDIDTNKLKKINIVNSSFDDTIDIAKKMIEEDKVDVFVCGGSNFKILKNVLSIPIVPIQITGFSIMDNLVKAKSISDDVSIITFDQPIVDFNFYKNIFNINILQKSYKNYNQLKVILHELKNQGINTVIGSSLVCDACKELNMNSIFIYSKHSIINAINQAIQIQESIEKEKYKNNQLNAILNYAYSGIMATDKENIIQVFNPMAERIMNLSSKNVVGKKVDKEIENTRLQNVLLSGKEEINQFQNINKKTILTSRVPIRVGNEVRGVVATFQDIKSVQKAEHKIRRKLYTKGLVSKYSFQDIKGNSKAIKETINSAMQFAKSDYTILINGESGTGKELFAQSIHNASARGKEAFVAINCATLQMNLLESELFGYEDGAFTGAKKGGKMGLFELAHNGTIFLDEISEIPIELQSRLLRVIQEKEVMRLGSDRIIPINVRIICATNKNLWKQVIDGKFREDLYYRLNVLNLRIPPLRERKEDISEISRIYISKKLPNLYQKYKNKWERIFILLMKYNLKGNVRELQNILKRISVIMNNKAVLSLSAEEIINKAYPKHEYEKSLSSRQESDLMNNNELSNIVTALSEMNGNMGKTAKKLGISRTTLWRKLNNIKNT